jgi:protocatechuate 3,4-dioxygenase beta subunit
LLDVSGELIRSDIREEQTGIDLLLDVQLLDVHTCKPLSNVLVDFWACNSTGIYSGVEAQNTVVSKWMKRGDKLLYADRSRA